MERLDRFAYAGMVSYSKPSTNTVGFFSPTHINTGIETGGVNVQTEISIQPGAYLCSNNKPIVVGDINPTSGHLHPGKVIVEHDAWLGHIGDNHHNRLVLGEKADGSLIVNGGRVLFEKGVITGNPDHIATIKINEGALSARSIELGAGSSFTLRHGLVKAVTIKGLFRIWVYGGLLSIEESIKTGTINLTGTGALLFGSGDHPLDATAMGDSGVNFVGDGGYLVAKILNPEGSLSKMYATESLFEGLRKAGKIKRDGVAIENFKDFRMEQIFGKNDHSYAVLHPAPPAEGRFGTISEKLRRLFYGENPSERIGI